MLYDRPYMRDSYQPARKTSALVWLVAAIISGFVLQLVFSRWFGIDRTFTQLFALSPAGFKSGQVWPLLSYAFLHDPENLLHIVGNLLGLYFLGRELLPVIGERRFLIFFGAASMIGGLLWLLTHWIGGRDYGLLIGASASVYGLLTIFACFYPDRRITLLLFFVFPVSLKPKHIAWAALGISACGFLFYEIMGAASPFGIAHSAHLGGMLSGWLYYRYLHERSWGRLELPKWVRRRAAASETGGSSNGKRAANAASAPKYRVNLSEPATLRAEVDRILDKINAQGFGALTDEEKRLLDTAKDHLSQR